MQQNNRKSRSRRHIMQPHVTQIGVMMFHFGHCPVLLAAANHMRTYVRLVHFASFRYAAILAVIDSIAALAARPTAGL